ncbi:hypothetical protein T484DRAFT_1829003, partial [Baffinella frigidus]
VPSHCIYSLQDGACQKGIPLLSDNLGTALAGSWNQALGTITFIVQASFQMVDTLAFTIQLRNAPSLQPAVTPTFAATGPAGSNFLILTTALAGSVLSSGLPLVEPVPTPPTLVRAQVREASKIEYEANNITVDAATNVPIPAGTIVELRSLDYTAQLERSVQGSWLAEALPAVTLIDLNGDGFEPTAQWQKSRPTRVDALPAVTLITLIGNGFEPTAQWQDAVEDGDLRAWMCDRGGWAASFDPYFIPGSLAGQGLTSVAAPSFGQQNWCLQQTPNSVLARTTRCFTGDEALSLSFPIVNGAVLPLGTAIVKPVVSLRASAVQNTRDAEGIFLASSVTGTCVGTFKCLSSILQDPTCKDPACTFLPPHAVRTPPPLKP